jgi:CheY-like chemotaxis protein
VVRETENLLRHLLRENIRIRLNLDPNLAHVKADSVQITQVILNLALNARDAMPDGGLLEISSGNSEIAAGDKNAPGRLPPGKYVRLRIRDTGAGMEEATKHRIFEPFFTTKEIGKGTGLGLSTVYGIIAQSEGHIEFDSALGMGTTFSIYFPAIKQTVMQFPQRTPPLQRQSAAVPYSVLVVEDEAGVRNSIAEALRREGFHVYTSGSSQEAWETALKERPSLLIADIMMNGMKGTELVEHLRKENPAIRTILISRYGEEEPVIAGALATDAVLMSKPFDINELVESAVRLCKLK